MFELFPRHSHRTPAQIAEDAHDSFEPMSANREIGTPGVRRMSTSSTSSHTEPDASANGRRAERPNR